MRFSDLVRYKQYTECRRKKTYYTVQEADRAASAMGKKYHCAAKRYACAHCGHFHLTTLFRFNRKSITQYLTGLGWDYIGKDEFSQDTAVIHVYFGSGTFREKSDNGEMSKTKKLSVFDH